MLPSIGEDQKEQTGERDSKLLHLASAARVFDLDQTGIVDRFREVDFGCPRPQRTTFDCRNCRFDCCRCCRHYAAPMNVCSFCATGICIVKISCSSSANCWSSGFVIWSTVAIKS